MSLVELKVVLSFSTPPSSIIYSLARTEVVKELKENIYVDDWLSSADSIEEGQVKFTEACSVLGEARMSLAKWTSNSKYTME